MTNYTRPNDLEHEDKPEDWLNSALVFAQAIGHLLKENEGVVVELKGAAKEGFETPKVIVYNGERRIHVTECDDNLNAGQMVWMHD